MPPMRQRKASTSVARKAATQPAGGFASDSDGDSGGSGDMMAAMMQNFQKAAGSKASSANDKAKLAKATKEIAREAREAIESFMNRRAEEDATTRASTGARLHELSTKCKQIAQELLARVDKSLDRTQGASDGLDKTLRDYKNMSIRHEQEKAQMCDEHAQEYANEVDKVVFDGMRTCRKEIEAAHKARTDKQHEMFDKVMRLLMQFN